MWAPRQGFVGRTGPVPLHCPHRSYQHVPRADPSTGRSLQWLLRPGAHLYGRQRACGCSGASRRDCSGPKQTSCGPAGEHRRCKVSAASPPPSPSGAVAAWLRLMCTTTASLRPLQQGAAASSAAVVIGHCSCLCPRNLKHRSSGTSLLVANCCCLHGLLHMLPAGTAAAAAPQ